MAMQIVRSVLVVFLWSVTGWSQVPAPSSPAPVAPAAPPSATGVGELLRLTDDLQRATDDVKRLQQRLPDWAAIGWYAEENSKLGPPPPGEPRVVFLGDSITHNWGNSKYSDYFHRRHQGFMPVNRGIGGQNVAQMLLRMRQDVIDLKPEVMVILAGTNDLPTFKVPDLLRFIEGNFDAIFDLAEKHHIRVIVCSILPVNDTIQNRTQTRPPQQILQLNIWLRRAAKERGLKYSDLYAALTDGRDRMNKDLTLDGLHPTATGYALMEPIVDAAIQQSLKQ
jgi:lysophospholipase L1-like esterase